MRGILSDPTTKTIAAIEYDKGLEGIYQALGCRSIDGITIDGDIFKYVNGVYVDDEALLSDTPPTHYFEIQTTHGVTNPIGSKGLVHGTDSQGETVDTRMTVDAVRKIVRFTERRLRGFQHRDSVVNHPVLGEVFQMEITPVVPVVDGSDEEPKPEI
jgi:hypothetical protein